jgi:hypothetical protein
MQDELVQVLRLLLQTATALTPAEQIMQWQQQQQLWQEVQGRVSPATAPQRTSLGPVRSTS